MVSPDGLERKYKVLASNVKTLRLHKQIAAAIVFCMIGLIVVVPSLLTALNIPTKDLAYGFIGSFIVVFIALFLVMVRSNKYVLEKDDMMFFRFYDSYFKSLTYVDAKSNQTKKEAKESIRRLFRHIDSWSESAPSQLIIIPISISKKIQEKVIPLLEEDNIEAISKFANHLSNFVFAIPNGVLITALTNLDVNLGHLDEPIKPKTIRGKDGIFHQYPYLKFICLGIMAGTLLYLTLSYNGADQSQAIGFSVATSVGITMGLPNLIRYKK